MWPSRAITFIDNHDTGSTLNHWPFPNNHLQEGYAYIITHPGTPCVFLDHLYQEKDGLRKVRGGGGREACCCMLLLLAGEAGGDGESIGMERGDKGWAAPGACGGAPPGGGGVRASGAWFGRRVDSGSLSSIDHANCRRCMPQDCLPPLPSSLPPPPLFCPLLT